MAASTLLRELADMNLMESVNTALALGNINPTFGDINSDTLTTGAMVAVGLVDTGGIASTLAIKSSGPTAGVGYATGAGGTVTQATNINTGVTINKVCGEIVLVTNASLAAAAEAAFTVTNSAVAATDVVVVSVKNQFTDGNIVPYVKSVSAGEFVIAMTNVDAAAVSAGTGRLSFAVIKAVAA